MQTTTSHGKKKWKTCSKPQVHHHQRIFSTSLNCYIPPPKKKKKKKLPKQWPGDFPTPHRWAPQTTLAASCRAMAFHLPRLGSNALCFDDFKWDIFFFCFGLLFWFCFAFVPFWILLFGFVFCFWFGLDGLVCLVWFGWLVGWFVGFGHLQRVLAMSLSVMYFVGPLPAVERFFWTLFVVFVSDISFLFLMSLCWSNSSCWMFVCSLFACFFFTSSASKCFSF